VGEMMVQYCKEYRECGNLKGTFAGDFLPLVSEKSKYPPPPLILIIILIIFNIN
jgi:hypothetical protein